MAKVEAQPRRSLFSLLLALCLGLSVCAVSVRAQIGNASLSGTVSDQSGGVVAGAELTLINTALNIKSQASSNERGEYTFRNLNPGSYELRVSKSGFENYVETDISITMNASAHADVALKVGTPVETVTVEASNTLINFDNGNVQGGADPQTIQDLPLVVEGKPRSSAALAVLLPGISTGSSSEAFQARINGGLESGDEALLDGATMQEGFMSQSGMVSIQQDFQMSPDMVQEVKVLTSSYDPQYGSSTGGEITMVSKSGTTQYHGAAFEYNRNAALNANSWNNNFSGLPRPPDNENNFGANFGGPFKIPRYYTGQGKFRTFFYFNWEAYHQAGGSSTSVLSIPSALERNGNFTDWGQPVYAPGNFAPGSVPSQATGPQSTACANALPKGFGPGMQFPGNIIPTACISPIAAAYLSYMPAPTNTNPTNNYNLPKPVPDNLTGNANVYMTRIDQNIGDRDHIYFFWWRQYSGFLTQTALPTAIAYESPAHPENSPISRLNWEHTFNSTTTNHATLGYLNRNEGYSSENLAYIGKLPQIAGAAGTNALPAFSFSNGFTSISNSNGPGATNVTVRPTWAFNDTATKVLGHHTITFGGEWRSVQGNIHASGNESGTYSFDSSTTSLSGAGGSPVAGFLLGAVSTGSVDRRTVSAWYPRQSVYALHVNDSWRFTPKLTLNFGLRWDYYTPSREKNDNFSFIDLVGTNPDAGGLPGRLAFAGDSGACKATDSCYGAPYPEKPWKKGFAPRLGIAYAWNDKTVIRAGYGIFFAQAFYPGWGGGMSLDGFNLHQTFATTPSASGAVNPAFYLDNGVPQPASPPPNITAGFDNGALPTQANGNGSGYRPVDGNRRPYAQQWNLTIERQLPYEIFVSVATVGNKGTRLPSSLNPVNALDPFDANIQTLEAPITPLNPSCTTSTPTGNCSYVPELNAKFTGEGQTLYGVKEPYAGWFTQLSSPTSACAPTVAQALLPFPQFCGNLQGLDENHGNSIYNSFQLKIEKRYSKGLYMLVSYTNSKLLSDASDNTQQNAELGTQQGVISPYQESRARSISSDDVPQVVNAAFVYDLPFGRGQKYANQGAFLDRLVGGWQFSPIIHYSRGTPMWFRSSNSCQIVPQFRQACLVAVTGADPFLQDPTNYDPGKGPLLNAAAFESVSDFCIAGTNPTCKGAFGFTGEGPRISNLRGPNSKNVDFALTKNTRITERLVFQLRFGFFNAFNMHVFTLNNPNNINNQGSNFAFNNDISQPNFGGWNGGVSSPRTIQVAGRIQF